MTIEPLAPIPTATECRRALEALRSGVPNRDAVRVLGCGQAEVEGQFLHQLDALRSSVENGEPVRGLLVSGDFGTGKSHVLEYLQHLALSRNFVCSRVVISKETPLYDLGKLFKAAVDAAEVPDLTGPAVSEIALKIDPNSRPYADFYRWTHHDDSGLSAMFPATLFLYEKLKSDPELAEKITNFWSGERIPIADIRGGLRQIGELSTYPVKAVKLAQLARERFAFVSRLILGAGYSGWALLIDEVELIGRYSILQRGKSYAELARLMGKIEEDGIVGITAVATITTDFDIAVLQEKGDRDAVGPKLRSKGSDDWAVLAARAETGMRMIERDDLELVPPDELELRTTYDRLRDIHGQAYGWVPPDAWGSEDGTPRRMRSHVRRWIAEWDLRRLYPQSPVDLEEEELEVEYGEDTTLERAPEESHDDGAGLTE